MFHNDGSLSALVASFGGIFIALKYKLDCAVYHKSLFEERYQVFLTIHDILFCPEQQSWQKQKEKIDGIYRKSYFLFGKETYQFMKQLNNTIITLSFMDGDSNLSEEEKDTQKKMKQFINYIKEGQNLSKKFPELKIDAY